MVAEEERDLKPSDKLLSKIKRERPVCFKAEDFFEDDFDIDSFLALNRKSFTLDSLKKDLDNYSMVIQNSLVELINRDYADFVNLSTNLVGVDQTILKLEAPLTSIRADVETIRTSLDDEIQLINTKLQQRNDIRTKQETLQGFLCIQKLTEKIERLIDSKNEDKECLFERVATEYSQLQFYVNKSVGLPFTDMMQPRIAKISEYLEGGLHDSFSRGLAANDREVVTQCLRIFTTLGKEGQAENLFAHSVITPAVDQVISREYLEKEGIDGMYRALLEIIPPCTDLVLSLTKPSQDNEIRNFDFISKAVLPTLVKLLCDRVPSIFGVGNPKVFQKNYKSTLLFISSIEHLCQYRERVEVFRDQESYKTFMARWSLPIYFQIRVQEVAGSLEHQLLTPFTDCNNSEFLLPTTTMTLLCIRRCWDEEVMIPALVHRFWKLTLQILSRYSSWVREVLTSSDELVVSDVTHLVSDSSKLCNMLPGELESLTSPYLTWTEPLSACASTACQAILATYPALGHFVCDSVVAEGCKALEHAQAVPRLYRRTNKESPSTALPYVSQLTSALEADICSSTLPKEYSDQWAQSAAQSIVERYQQTVSEVLTSLRKTEDSLAMLKRGRKAATPVQPSSTVSDEDKIRCQLRLDVEQLGVKLEELGIVQGEGFTKLLGIVQNR